MRKHSWIVVSVLLMGALAAPSVAADESSAPTATKNESGYRYNFDDDPLQAGGLGPLGSRITLMARVARATLIRPRTAFVAELLKSVEHL